MKKYNLIIFLAITLGLTNAMEGAEVDRRVTFIGLSGEPVEGVDPVELDERYFDDLCKMSVRKTISGGLEEVFRGHLKRYNHQMMSFIKHNDNKVYAVLDGIDADFRVIGSSLRQKYINVEVSSPDCPPGTNFTIWFHMADQDVLDLFFHSVKSEGTTKLSILNERKLRPLIGFRSDYEGGYAFVKATPFALKALSEHAVGIPESLEHEVLEYFHVSSKNIVDINENLSIRITGCPQAEVVGNVVFLEQLSNGWCYRVFIGPLGNRQNFTIMNDINSYHFQLTKENLDILKVIPMELLSTCTNSHELFYILLEAGISLTDANDQAH